LLLDVCIRNYGEKYHDHRRRRRRHGDRILPAQGFVASPLRLTQALAAQFRQDGGNFAL